MPLLASVLQTCIASKVRSHLANPLVKRAGKLIQGHGLALQRGNACLGHRLQKLSCPKHLVTVPQNVTVPKHQLALVDHRHSRLFQEVGNGARPGTYGQRPAIQRQLHWRRGCPVLMHPCVPRSHQILASLATLRVMGVHIRKAPNLLQPLWNPCTFGCTICSTTSVWPAAFNRNWYFSREVLL